LKKLNLLTILILVTTVLTGTGKAYADAVAEQTLGVFVSPAVDITKTSSNETGTMTFSGSHEGLSASFEILNNSAGENYEFLVGAKITTLGGEVSGYTSTGALMFGNTSILPSGEAAEDARVGGSNNMNVIAYPVTMKIDDSSMTVNFEEGRAFDIGTGCYVVNVKSSQRATLTQTIGTNPVSGSYSKGGDQAGTYKATIYFTSLSN